MKRAGKEVEHRLRCRGLNLSAMGMTVKQRNKNYFKKKKKTNFVIILVECDIIKQ